MSSVLLTLFFLINTSILSRPIISFMFRSLILKSCTFDFTIAPWRSGLWQFLVWPYYLTIFYAFYCRTNFAFIRQLVNVITNFTLFLLYLIKVFRVGHLCFTFVVSASEKIPLGSQNRIHIHNFSFWFSYSCIVLKISLAISFFKPLSEIWITFLYKFIAQ